MQNCVIDRRDYVEFYKEFLQCELDSLDIPYNATEIDTDAYLDRILGDSWSVQRTDSAIFTGIVGKCVSTKMNGGRPVYRVSLSNKGKPIIHLMRLF